MLTETTTAEGMRIWHARPDATGPRPAVLLLHERYGPVEHSFVVLERMAEYGFVAAMPDLFHRYTGEREPIESAQARVEITDDEVIVDLDATVRYLRSLPYVAPGGVGVAGFCLSGRAPIVYAAARPSDVAGICITHGGIYPRDYKGEPPGQASVAGLIPKLQCPILGMFGEKDWLVPMEYISRFRRELERTGKSYWVRIFAGTPHGWMNATQPDHYPTRYHARSAEIAWNILSQFYTDVFDGAYDASAHTWLFQPDKDLAYDFSS